MRDIDRIDKVCEALAHAWKRVPDMRFMQLISNFQSWCRSDCFYLEEDKFLEKLNLYLDVIGTGKEWK